MRKRGRKKGRKREEEGEEEREEGEEEREEEGKKGGMQIRLGTVVNMPLNDIKSTPLPCNSNKERRVSRSR